MTNEKKVVIVGDGAIGKTFLLNALLAGEEGTDPLDWDNPAYTPTAADNKSVEWELDIGGKTIDFDIEIWDTAGQEALSNLRTMAYPDTDIFLMGFDMTRRSSLENITGYEPSTLVQNNITNREALIIYGEEDPDADANPKGLWIMEVNEACQSEYKIILVGTKYDYWQELMEQGQTEELVQWDEAYDVAKAIDASMLICTSAKTFYGVKSKVDGSTWGGPPDTMIADDVWLKDNILNLCHAINESIDTFLPPKRSVEEVVKEQVAEEVVEEKVIEEVVQEEVVQAPVESEPPKTTPPPQTESEKPPKTTPIPQTTGAPTSGGNSESASGAAKPEEPKKDTTPQGGANSTQQTGANSTQQTGANSTQQTGAGSNDTGKDNGGGCCTIL